jgi:hypothetical protein
MVPRHLSACVTLGLLLSRTLLAPKACCRSLLQGHSSSQSCNRAATELQQSCSRSLLRGHRSSLSDPTHHPFTGSLQTLTPLPAQNPRRHATLRPYLPCARSYSIGSTQPCFIFTAEYKKSKALYHLRGTVDGPT